MACCGRERNGQSHFYEGKDEFLDGRAVAPKFLPHTLMSREVAAVLLLELAPEVTRR